MKWFQISNCIFSFVDIFYNQIVGDLPYSNSHSESLEQILYRLDIHELLNRKSSWIVLFQKLQVVKYSDLQKHESSCLLSDCFPCISPEPLEQKKVIYIYLHPCLKSFQMKKDFSNPVTKSAESKLLEKIHHFEKIKNFFSWI